MLTYVDKRHYWIHKHDVLGNVKQDSVSELN